MRSWKLVDSVMKFHRPSESFAARGIQKSTGYSRQKDGLAAPFVQFSAKGSGRPAYEDVLEVQAIVAGLTDEQTRGLVRLELELRADVVDEATALQRGRDYIRNCVQMVGGRVSARAA